MRKSLFLLLFAIQLFATMILNLNVKEQKNSVDLFINFDIPYEGKIVEKIEKDRIVLFLKKVKILASWSKKLHNPFIYQIDVIPTLQGTQIIIYTVKKLHIKAARSKDGFSLKLSFKPPLQTKVPTAKNGSNYTKFIYWIVGFIAAALLLLLLFKLFAKPKPRRTKKIVVEPSRKEDFHIKFEKPLDEHNKIALISFHGIDYLVIIGINNILLGKFKDGEIATHEDFEKAIDLHNLPAKEQQTKEEDNLFTTIEEYKKKASGEL